MTYFTENNNILLTNLEDTQLIHMPSRFTAIEADFFKKKFQQCCNSCKLVQTGLDNFTLKKVIIDFGQTTFMDNAGLIGLCQILRLAKEKKIALSFLSFSPQVKMILSLSGLEEFFFIENNTDL